MKADVKKYLPSKKFTIIMGVVLGSIIIIFVLLFFFSGKTSFISGKAGDGNGLSIQEKTVNDFLRADLDLDGVMDWEEALWGTDKTKKSTFDGIPDSTYIANRKKELNIQQEGIQNEEDLTETEKFAREFFSSYTALRSSGEVDSNTINDFASALGNKIATTELENIFSEKDIKVSENDTVVSRKDYYNSIKSLYEEYKNDGIGKEISILGDKLGSSQNTTPKENDYDELLVISQAYQAFAEKMKDITVPKSLKNYHLIIINTAYNTGVSVMNMQKAGVDPVMSIAGLSQYQKYSSELVGIVAVLENDLANE